MFRRELTFAVIAFILVVPASVFLSLASSAADVDALKKESHPGMKCTVNVTTKKETCCWSEFVPSTFGTPKQGLQNVCQTCSLNLGTGMYNLDCEPREIQMRGLPTDDLPQLETVPPNRTLPGGGVGDLPTLEQVPSNRTLPGGGLGSIPTLQQQERELPLPVVCSEEAGLVKDPETGQCVPIVQPPPSPPRDTEPQQEEQEEPEEQSSDNGGDEQSEDGGEEDGSSADTGNNNDGDN